jgi:hypothetical protein
MALLKDENFQAAKKECLRNRKEKDISSENMLET